MRAASGLQHARGHAGARCTLPLAPRRPVRAARVQVAASSGCPYSTLGVSASASEAEIKTAYRKLVLQYHPDINHGTGAERRFMSIQQAYELLTGKSRNLDGSGTRRSDWAFHDWYWSFQQKRRWGSYKRGAAAAAAAAAAGAAGAAGAGEEPGAVPLHKQPEHQSTLRSQLAGLRHRAAIRARKQPRSPVAAAAASGAQGEAAAAAGAPAAAAAPQEQPEPPPQQQQQPEADAAPLDYDSSQMSDGCNMASGITDWAAAAAQAATQRRFAATDSHRQQLSQQMAGLHRRAVASHDASGGLW